MTQIGYVICFTPWTWVRRSDEKRCHRYYYDQVREFYNDEAGYRERLAELQRNIYEDSCGNVYDGVEINYAFECEVRRVEL